MNKQTDNQMEREKKDVLDWDGRRIAFSCE